MNETLFYIFGITLAVSAVVFSFAGLKISGFPGKAAPLIVLWFAILVGGATTFAVLHAKDEDKEKAAKFEEAGKEIEKAETSGPYEEAEERASKEAQGGGKEAEAKGPGGTLQLAASPTELKFDKTQLTSKPGKVTIDFENPSAIEHDVAIEKNGEQIAATPRIKESKAVLSAELAPGTYTFLCTVPGHAEAGMEGTLVVK